MKNLTGLLLISIAIGLIWNTLAYANSSQKPANIAELIKKGALIIDVRTAEEFDSGHISGSINIPYNKIGEQIGNHQENTDHPIVVYCHSGARSAHATKILKKMGYTAVVNGGSLRKMRKLSE